MNYASRPTGGQESSEIVQKHPLLQGSKNPHPNTQYPIAYSPIDKYGGMTLTPDGLGT